MYVSVCTHSLEWLRCDCNDVATPTHLLAGAPSSAATSVGNKRQLQHCNWNAKLNALDTPNVSRCHIKADSHMSATTGTGSYVCVVACNVSLSVAGLMD